MGSFGEQPGKQAALAAAKVEKAPLVVNVKLNQAKIRLSTIIVLYKILCTESIKEFTWRKPCNLK